MTPVLFGIALCCLLHTDLLGKSSNQLYGTCYYILLPGICVLVVDSDVDHVEPSLVNFYQKWF